MPTYPSDPNVSIVREKDVVSDRTLLHRFSLGTHTGTHLDVPAHIIAGGKTLDDFSISTFFFISQIAVHEEIAATTHLFESYLNQINYLTVFSQNQNICTIFIHRLSKLYITSNNDQKYSLS